MTNDEKIDELLRIVQGHESRFDRMDAKFDLQEAKDEAFSKQLLELKDFLLEDRKVSHTRFSQMENSMNNLQQEVGKMNVSLNAKIDLLSADMHGVSEELYETKRRVTRLEKKLLS